MIELNNIHQLQIQVNGQNFPENIDIMDLYLSGNYCFLKNESDFKSIPKSSGNYWILTNKPICHSFNNKFHHRPKPCYIENNSLSVIYNGQSDNLQTRIKQHLLRKNPKGINDLSGISIEIYKGDKQFKSHNKYLYTEKNNKKPYYEKEQRSIDWNDIINHYNIKEKKDYIFKNGISVIDEEHKNFIWLVIYYPMNKFIYHPLSDYIERQWRIHNGMPILNSYSSGR